CTYLERDEEVSDMSGLHPAYALRQQVVEPIGEARPSWQIWKDAFDDQCTGANTRYPLISELKQILLDTYYGRDFTEGEVAAK
ncbi:molybdopterin-dependent oxidoreductase, partial [Salmonella enterica subsp. enterica serovar Kentucky]|nr:molybdopterin-dependent oxidoreductase [Salmonella enterica subsp. enterica serovar Kentucky]